MVQERVPPKSKDSSFSWSPPINNQSADALTSGVAVSDNQILSKSGKKKIDWLDKLESNIEPAQPNSRTAPNVSDTVAFNPGVVRSPQLNSVTGTENKLELDNSALDTQDELQAFAIAIPIGYGIAIALASGGFIVYWQRTEKDREEVFRVIVDWTTDTVGSVTDRIVNGLEGLLGGAAEKLRGAIEVVVSYVFQSKKKKESNNGDGRNAANDTPLSKDEIERLKEGGVDIHELKGKKNASKRDLYKDAEGNIYVKPKGGREPGEETGLNINDF